MAQPLLIVGSYTSEGTSGVTIYRYSVNPLAFDLIGAVDTPNASYMALSTDRDFVYVVNENGNALDQITAIKREGENFQVVNTSPSGGSSACYISVSRHSKHVFAANYHDGVLYAVPLLADGSLADTGQKFQNEGSGPDQRQEAAHLHSAVLSPNEDYLLTADLGIDQINVYQYTSSDIFEPLELAYSVKLPAGTGPRHMVFSADSRFLYVIGELNATLHVFSWTANKLEPLQNINMMPAGFSDFNSAADIHLSPDGAYLYASNRADVNQLVIFQVDKQTGLLTRIGAQETKGEGPRNFVIEPQGRHIFVAHQQSNDIRIFERDAASGALNDTGVTIPVVKPIFLACVL